MPQMAPINWLMLFFMFILLFMMFIIMNYFSFMYPVKIKKSTKSKKLISWKW